MEKEEKKIPQMKPSSGKPSTESMSPVELADGLEKALDVMTEENYDPAIITQYLDALDERVPMPETPDWQKAYADFRHTVEQAVNAPREGPSRSLRVHRFARLRRVAVSFAAAVTVLLGSMVAAQAAGVDIFGNLARWTDEHFVFLRTSDVGSLSPEYLAQVSAELNDNRLPHDLYPAWWPERFTFDGTDSWDNNISNGVDIIFQADSGEVFSFCAERYAEDFDMETVWYEKDETPPELYTKNDRTFYILSNIDTMTAVYSDGPLAITIGGSLSVDEMKQIIDSIGGSDQ